MFYGKREKSILLDLPHLHMTVSYNIKSDDEVQFASFIIIVVVIATFHS